MECGGNGREPLQGVRLKQPTATETTTRNNTPPSFDNFTGPATRNTDTRGGGSIASDSFAFDDGIPRVEGSGQPHHEDISNERSGMSDDWWWMPTQNAGCGSGGTRAGTSVQDEHAPQGRGDSDENTENGENPLDAGQGVQSTTSSGIRRVCGARHGAPKRGTKCKKKTKASIKIASLNMRGHGNVNVWHPKNKWNHINQLMREKKIGILLVNETHLNEERTENIENLFGSRLKVFYTEGPNGPNAEGVAIVLNKEMTNIDDLTVTEVIPGRALLIETIWHGKERVSILAIYAPNDINDNAEFWKQVRLFFEENPLIRRPDIVAGDCNIVEDPIDRLPRRSDRDVAVDELDELKTSLQLIDGWRETYPNTAKYTHMHKPANSQARLDRIYVRANEFEHTYEWRIERSGIFTDHMMVSVKFSSEAAPEIGNGRWVWPAHLLKDPGLKKYINQKGIELQDDLQRVQELDCRSDNHNVQTLWKEFKQNITKKARETAKIVIPKLEKEIRSLETRMDQIINDVMLEEEERIQCAAILTEKIVTLEKRRHKTNRTSVKARNILEGEVISKYWSGINKSRKPRDTIQRLRIPGMEDENEDVRYERNTQRMADIAKDYHNEIQSERRDIDPQTRNEQILFVTGMINKRTPNESIIRMKNNLTEEDVSEALKLSGNDKAPGLDGIMYEIYKVLADRFGSQKATGSPVFDIVKVLCNLYNDIERNGMVANTGFADSWMCPLYKKNDRANIANYRPISLLNTDYKIFTKALTIKLAKAAPHLIHPNQAGFVPGRHIYDQIWLSKFIIELVEANEQNGVIVCLDQEKAYDKIEHDYLWESLRAFNIPEEFIGTVRTLYSDANTWVMINGVASSTPFKVERGVRQGDPLSCLLFDLAIEPLAEMLRQSDLKGFNIPGYHERIIATLFADDTTTYLSEEDDFGTLMQILDTWCIASGAKFNISKTEVIPIGEKEYRRQLEESRKMNGPDGTEIPDHIRIVGEGESARSLGAMIGNGVCQVDVWSRILEKVDVNLKRWERGNPTMEGRRLISLMIGAGVTQYPTKVQGMPKEIENRLDKRIRKFLWNDKASTINKETIHAPVEKGGRNLLDIVSRNEAISLTWLRSFLDFGPERPAWASAAEALMVHNIRGTDSKIEDSCIANIYLQSWKTCVTRLPEDLKKMMELAEKYKVRLDALALPRDILREMPIWFNTKSNAKKSMFSRGCAACLREKHGVETVGDAEILAKATNPANHRRSKECKCNVCENARTSLGCLNPNGCFQKARDMLNSLPAKWNPLTKVLPEDMEASDAQGDRNNTQDYGDQLPEQTKEIRRKFDKKLTLSGTLADAFRIFTKHELEDLNPIKLPPRRLNVATVTVYTDGSASNVGTVNANAGAGIYFGPRDRRNRSIRVPSTFNQTNQVAELLAVKEAIELIPKGVDMKIVTDSMYVIDSLTTLLPKIEEDGYMLSENRKLIELTVALIRQRSGNTLFEWVKGHSGVEGNEEADKLAAKGSEKTPAPLRNMNVLAALRVDGAKVNKLTQAKAYKLIRSQKMETQAYQESLNRTATSQNMEFACAAAGEFAEVDPTPKHIWKSLRSKDISRSGRYFLWMLMHDGYKVGRYWERTRNLQDRAECTGCGTREDMKHILTQCEIPGQKEIWELTSKVWKKKTGTELNITMGDILACGAVNVAESKGRSRLRRILIAESAHLIWKVRNARVIDGKDAASKREVENRWFFVMNGRLEMDQVLSNKAKYGSKALKKPLVLQTWSGILKDEEKLPEDWIKEKGVLVGVT